MEWCDPDRWINDMEQTLNKEQAWKNCEKILRANTLQMRDPHLKVKAETGIAK